MLAVAKPPKNTWGEDLGGGGNSHLPLGRGSGECCKLVE